MNSLNRRKNDTSHNRLNKLMQPDVTKHAEDDCKTNFMDQINSWEA
jgi:hypothetical protein